MKIIRNKFVLGSLLILVTFFAIDISSLSITARGASKGRFVNVVKHSIPFMSDELIIFADGKGINFKVVDENLYSQLMSSDVEYLEVKFYQSFLGELLGLAPTLESFKAIDPKVTRAKVGSGPVNAKIDRNYSCLLFGSLTKNHELYKEILAHLDQHEPEALKLMEQCGLN